MNITRLPKSLMKGSPCRQLSHSSTVASARRLHRNPSSSSKTRAVIRPQSTSSKTPAKPPNNHDPPTRPKPSNIESPVVNFQSLGIKGPAKVVVIAVFCVLATIESVFWAKVGWRWWNGEVDQEEDEEQKEVAK